jgi:riboflavin synthase
MFTGIIETTGVVRRIESSDSNRDFWIESNLAPELKIDQSLAHNGVCLTVVDIQDTQYRVTAVDETLAKTTLGEWQPGKKINLERALRAGDRLDGHFVQGHVDAIAVCTERTDMDGSWLFGFRFPESFASLIVEKGSVCIDGVSLTAFNVGKDTFSVAIIPYTFSHTGFNQLMPEMPVNIEFDVLGKYLLRHEMLKGNRLTQQSS